MPYVHLGKRPGETVLIRASMNDQKVGEGHAGQLYELSGPEALSLPRTAQLLSRAAGRPVTHREITIDEAAAAGSAGFERDLFALTFERVHVGSFAVVTDTVERVTGGRPGR